MNHRRMLAFSLLVLLALVLPGLALAMTLGWKPLLFGDTPEAAGASFRLIDSVVTGVVVSLVYAWLLWPMTKNLAAHAVIVFLAVEAVQLLAGLVFGDSIADAFVWQAFLTDALYAAIGVLLVVGWRSIRATRAR